MEYHSTMAFTCTVGTSTITAGADWLQPAGRSRHGVPSQFARHCVCVHITDASCTSRELFTSWNRRRPGASTDLAGSQPCSSRSRPCDLVSPAVPSDSNCFIKSRVTIFFLKKILLSFNYIGVQNSYPINFHLNSMICAIFFVPPCNVLVHQKCMIYFLVKCTKFPFPCMYNFFHLNKLWCFSKNLRLSHSLF